MFSLNASSSVGMHHAECLASDGLVRFASHARGLEYSPPWYLPSGLLQTAAAALHNASGYVKYSREDLPLDAVDWEGRPPACTPSIIPSGRVGLDWFVTSSTGPVAVIVPGLTGDMMAPYVVRIAQQLAKANYRPVVYNPRGLGGLPLDSPFLYSCGYTHDLRRALQHISTKETDIVAVGYSMGAGYLAKYLGEEAGGSLLKAACCLAGPTDCTKVMAHLSSGLMGRCVGPLMVRSLQTLRAELETIAESVPHSFEYDFDGAKDAADLAEFDGCITAPMMGCDSAADFYEKGSAVHVLPHIAVPTLFVHAANDPVIPAHTLCKETVAANPHLISMTTQGGGHSMDWPAKGMEPWAPSVVVRFLGMVAGSEGTDSTHDASTTEPPHGRYTCTAEEAVAPLPYVVWGHRRRLTPYRALCSLLSVHSNTAVLWVDVCALLMLLYVWCTSATATCTALLLAVWLLHSTATFLHDIYSCVSERALSRWNAFVTYTGRAHSAARILLVAVESLSGQSTTTLPGVVPITLLLLFLYVLMVTFDPPHGVASAFGREPCFSTTLFAVVLASLFGSVYVVPIAVFSCVAVLSRENSFPQKQCKGRLWSVLNSSFVGRLCSLLSDACLLLVLHRATLLNASLEDPSNILHSAFALLSFATKCVIFLYLFGEPVRQRIFPKKPAARNEYTSSYDETTKVTTWRPVGEVEWSPVAPTLKESVWYFVTVTLNFQANLVVKTLPRMLLLLWNGPAPFVGDPKEGYTMVMGTALLMWVGDDLNVHLYDTSLPVGNKLFTFFGGSRSELFPHLCFELDHERKEVGAFVAYNSDGSERSRITDVQEVLTVLWTVLVVRVHFVSHLNASEVVHNSKWDDARSAAVCVSGLNGAITDSRIARMVFTPDMEEDIKGVLMAGVPHRKARNVVKCLQENSGLYRAAVRAHSDPRLKALVGSGAELSSVVSTVLFHSADHFILERCALPWYMVSKFLETNLTFARHFAAIFVDDIASCPSELSGAAAIIGEIVQDEAPEMRRCLHGMAVQ